MHEHKTWYKVNKYNSELSDGKSWKFNLYIFCDFTSLKIILRFSSCSFKDKDFRFNIEKINKLIFFNASILFIIFLYFSKFSSINLDVIEPSYFSKFDLKLLSSENSLIILNIPNYILLLYYIY